MWMRNQGRCHNSIGCEWETKEDDGHERDQIGHKTIWTIDNKENSDELWKYTFNYDTMC